MTIVLAGEGHPACMQTDANMVLEARPSICTGASDLEDTIMNSDKQNPAHSTNPEIAVVPDPKQGGGVNANKDAEKTTEPEIAVVPDPKQGGGVE